MTLTRLFSDFTVQVEHVLSPEGSDPQNLWRNCRMDITKCSSKQLEILQGCNGIYVVILGKACIMEVGILRI